MSSCRATNAKPFAAPPGGYDGQSVGSAWVRDGAVAVYCGPSDGTETTLAKSVTFVLP